MAFHDVAFPTGIARGASGGPVLKTDVITLASGHESRNARWRNSRRRYNAAYGIKTLDDLYSVISFFEERRGKLHSFRFRDPFDHKSCPPLNLPAADDQVLDTGDGIKDRFRLRKTYGHSETAQVRYLKRVRPETLIVAVDGAARAMGQHFDWLSDEGEIHFLPGSVPGTDEIISAGFAFDVEVRFDTDEIVTSLSAFQAGEIPSIPLVEVLS